MLNRNNLIMFICIFLAQNVQICYQFSYGAPKTAPVPSYEQRGTYEIRDYYPSAYERDL